MADQPWDAIIVGQGLAGTTLAWHLHDAGQRVLLIDPDNPVSSSKIAAGLMTPLTGRRFALSGRYNTLFLYARAFYQRIEAVTGQSFFHDRVGVRLFQSEDERQHWLKRSAEPALQPYLLQPKPVPLLDAAFGAHGRDGIAMVTAQLDVPEFLAASRARLPNVTRTLDWQRDVELANDQSIAVAGHVTRCLISCEGYAATANPYFSQVPFKAAKGEILTVRLEQPLPPTVVHCGVWIAPTAQEGVVKVGSTYDWATLDQRPTRFARDDIERKLQAVLTKPYTVIDHEAAVRPIIQQSKPVMGLHPTHRQLGFFNGLGSKGSVHAPWYAKAFAAHLIDGRALPDGSNLSHWLHE